MPETSTAAASFSFTAQTSSGARAEGTLEAASPASARASLQAMGLQALEVAPEPVARPPRRAGALDLVAFNAQLAHLLEAGVPMEQGLRLVAAEAGKGRLADGVRKVADELEQGLDLPAAVEKHKSLFPPLYAQLVAAGIKAGNLPGVLASLSRHLEFDRQLRQMVWRASVYPLIVVAGVGGAGLFFACWVFPAFTETFKQFDARQPWLTTFCLNYLDPISVAVLLFPAILLLALALLRASGKSGWVVDHVLLRVPLLSRVISRSLSARWCDAVQLGLATGMDLPAAMRMAADAGGSTRMAHDTERLCQQVEAGNTPNDSATLTVLPPVVPLALGAACLGELDASTALARLAATLREQAEYRMATLQTWLVPLTIVGLGLTVGMMIVALFLPMIAIMQSLMGVGR